MLMERYPHAVPISAATGQGVPILASRVGQSLSRDFVELEVTLPLADGKTVAWLTMAGEILSKQYHEEGVLIHCRLPASHAGKLLTQGFELRVLKGTIPQAAPPSSFPDTASYKTA
jgi:GTP-binding protein HflX